jgi:N-acetylneuraminic acid mutarotase
VKQIGLVIVGVAAAMLVGFEAGRRYPWETLAFLRGRTSEAARPAPTGWAPRRAVPAARYEAPAAVADGRLFVFGGFHERNIAALGSVEVFDPGTGEWTSRADMPSRVTHRNPVVVGDTIWLAGGFVGDDPGPTTAETWKYVPGADRWIAGPPLPAPRAGGVLFEHGGMLHYVGGFGVDRDTSRADHWTLKLRSQDAGWRSAPPLPRARGHVAGVTLGGFLYVIGGCVRHDPVQVDVDWVDRFDPATGTWLAVAPLPTPRSHVEPSTFVHGGRIYVVGGRDNSSATRTPREIVRYDPATDSWTSVGRAPDGRVAPIAIPIGDSLYVGAGADRSYFAQDASFWVRSLRDPWTHLADLPGPLHDVTAGAVDGSLLVVGEDLHGTYRLDLATGRWDGASLATRPVLGHGHGGEVIDGRWHLVSGAGGAPMGHVQVLDVAANRWSLAPDLHWQARASATAALNGTLYVFGGTSHDTTVGTAAALAHDARDWRALPPMPVPRHGAAAVTDGRRLLVFGGCRASRGATDAPDAERRTLQIYDPALDQWSDGGVVPGGPAPRCGLRAVHAEGRIWIFGGTPGAALDRVHVYDPASRAWHEGPPMPVTTSDVFPVLVGRRIYLVVGSAEPQAPRAGVWLLDLELAVPWLR